MNNFTEGRYSRQIMLTEIGRDGQKKLSESTVLVVGAGGLGSAAIPYLAAAGIGRIIITDPDVLSISNLNRQILYETASLGQSKAPLAAKRIQALNPEVDVIADTAGLTPENARSLVRKADIVIDCCDNFPTRLLIDKACSEEGKPWIFGAVQEFCGEIALFNHREGKHLTDLFPDLEEINPTSSGPRGILGAVAGTVGALEALECIKFLAGMEHIPEGELQVIDFNNISITKYEF